MTSRHGSRQRAGVMATTAVLPPRTIWLISTGPPALVMRTPHGAPLINSPPVINGGDVREDVTPRERDLLEVNQSRMLGRMMRRSAALDRKTRRRKNRVCQNEASGQANSLALNWLVRFVFHVELIFIIFYVMTNRLNSITRWMINAGNNWLFPPSCMISIRGIRWKTCYC